MSYVKHLTRRPLGDPDVLDVAIFVKGLLQFTPGGVLAKVADINLPRELSYSSDASASGQEYLVLERPVAVPVGLHAGPHPVAQLLCKDTLSVINLFEQFS
jgi:hypothetical protein